MSTLGQHWQQYIQFNIGLKINKKLPTQNMDCPKKKPQKLCAFLEVHVCVYFEIG